MPKLSSMYLPGNAKKKKGINNDECENKVSHEIPCINLSESNRSHLGNIYLKLIGVSAEVFTHQNHKAQV